MGICEHERKMVRHATRALGYPQFCTVTRRPPSSPLIPTVPSQEETFPSAFLRSWLL